VPTVKEEIESRFQSRFEEMAQQIRVEFPNVHAKVSSFLGGLKTENHVHVLSLECLFTEASATEPDLLALCVRSEHVNTHPEMHVDIGWGHPSGYVESDLFDAPMKFSDQTLDIIEAVLPKLYDRLRDVIKRGRPSNV